MISPVFFEGLQAEATVCAHCGYCRAVCPTYAGVGWESCSPRGRIQITQLLLEGAPVTADHMTRLYQCTMCGACTQVCPTRIDLRQFWLQARAETATRDLAPTGLSTARSNVGAMGNVYGYPNDERAGWAEYMDDAPDDLFQRDEADVVYFVGCNTSFSPRAQRIAESFVKLMTAAEVDFTILGEGEVCCGFPLQVAGMPDAVEALIEHNVAQVREKGAKMMVFTCPACRLMWMEEYAGRLPDVTMVHATEMLADLTAQGRIPLKELKTTVTYHDPCDLARNGGVYDAPRRALSAIPGLELVEVHERRERGMCCGGGGDLEMVDPGLAQRVSERTVGKLAATGASTIVTACPQCVRTLSRGAEACAPDVAVADLVEILARALDD
ncbi:MAG: (Fe-S)-binding protein [Anaerolineae bacterium]